MKMIQYLLLSPFFLLLFACDRPAPSKEVLQDKFELGTTAEGHYHNAYFDLDIYFDPTWNVQNKEQIELIEEAGEKIMVGENEALQAAADAASVNTAYLLSVFKHPLGAAVEYNPNFIAIVENVRAFPGIETGGDYIFNLKKVLTQTTMEYTYKEVYERRVGKKIFHVLEAETNYMGMEIRQHYLCVIERGFCLSFILSFNSEKEKEELYQIIDKVRI